MALRLVWRGVGKIWDDFAEDEVGKLINGLVSEIWEGKFNFCVSEGAMSMFGYSWLDILK